MSRTTKNDPHAACHQCCVDSLRQIFSELPIIPAIPWQAVERGNIDFMSEKEIFK